MQRTLDAMALLISSFKEYQKMRGSSGKEHEDKLQRAIEEIFVEGKHGSLQLLKVPYYMQLEVATFHLMGCFANGQIAAIYDIINLEGANVQEIKELNRCPVQFQAELLLRTVREVARKHGPDGDLAKFRSDIAKLLSPLDGKALIMGLGEAVGADSLRDSFDDMLDSAEIASAHEEGAEGRAPAAFLATGLSDALRDLLLHLRTLVLSHLASKSELEGAIAAADAVAAGAWAPVPVEAPSASEAAPLSAAATAEATPAAAAAVSVQPSAGGEIHMAFKGTLSLGILGRAVGEARARLRQLEQWGELFDQVESNRTVVTSRFCAAEALALRLLRDPEWLCTSTGRSSSSHELLATISGEVLGRCFTVLGALTELEAASSLLPDGPRQQVVGLAPVRVECNRLLSLLAEMAPSLD